MKKMIIIFLFLFQISGNTYAQNFGIHIKNNSGMDLIYSVAVDHGQVVQPGQINNGFTWDNYFNPNPVTGVEGHIKIFPFGKAYDQVDIYYINPFIGQGTYSVSSSNSLICKPLKWSILDNGNSCELEVEMLEPNSMFGKPVPVTLNNNGVIKGSIFWNANEIQSPELSPFGYAFSCKAIAPVTFTESNGPFTLEKTGTYNGKKGYFEGSEQVGTVTFETVPSSNNGIIELKYTISAVPVDLPVTMDITTDYSKSKWIAGPQKPKPGEDYLFIVGTFPNTSNTSVIVNNNVSEMKGVDFNCEGDWLKFDQNGNIVGGGTLINKITNRKNAPVLPGSGMINAVVKSAVESNQMIQAPAVQNKTQQTQVQKIRTTGAVKIKQ